MEKKESKIFGLPFALVFFVIALSILIDGFTYFFVLAPIRADINMLSREVAAQNVPSPTPTVVPTATPSATISPAGRVFVPSKLISPTPVK